MVEAWTTDIGSTLMFELLNKGGYSWIFINFWAAPSFTEYNVRVGKALHSSKTKALFFPLQWTRACLSLDSNKIKMVANGQLLVDKEYKKSEDTDRPANLSLSLGFFVDKYGFAAEYIGKFTDLGVFKSALSVQRMMV